jgi:hypothetical protein
MRRGSREAPVSLFSFQDVMVSTIGVTLLIILVLLLLAGKKAAAVLETAIEVVEQEKDKPTAPAPETIDDPTRLQLELLTLDDRIEELELLLDEAREAAQQARTETLLDTDEAVEAARQRKAAALAGELDELKNRRRVTYLLDKEDSDRTPLVIELGGGRAVLGGGGDEEAALALHNSNPSQLAKTVAAWIDGLPDRNQRVLVFVVRPSGVAAWHELEAILPRWSNDGIGHGLDLIAESWSTSGLLPGSKEKP